MQKSNFFLFIVLIIAFNCCNCDVQPPIWPDQWQQNFTDTMIFQDVYYETKGFWQYDYTKGREYIWREDCRADGATFGMFQDKTSCAQIVEGNKRYVYADQSDECCFCLSIGILKPNWMRLGGGEWLGYEYKDGQFYNSYRTYIFKPHAPIDMLYTMDGIQAALYRPDYTHRKMYLDVDTYRDYLESPEDLELPQSCRADGLALCKGGCAALRFGNFTDSYF